MKITRTMQDMVRVKRLAVHVTGSGPGFGAIGCLLLLSIKEHGGPPARFGFPLC
jgi:hypothetical protein